MPASASSALRRGSGAGGGGPSPGLGSMPLAIEFKDAQARPTVWMVSSAAREQPEKTESEIRAMPAKGVIA